MSNLRSIATIILLTPILWPCFVETSIGQEDKESESGSYQNGEALAEGLGELAGGIQGEARLSLLKNSIETPADYLEYAILLMELKSLYREDVEWGEVRANAASRTIQARTFADTYPAIRQALRDIKDFHGFLSTPKRQVAETDPNRALKTEGKHESAPSAGPPKPEVRLLKSEIGYIRIYFYKDQGFTKNREYVADLHQRIGEIAAREPVGWIVDLRDNGGGNMWPMLYGIGPILGEGVVGYFIDPNGSRSRWYYWRGKTLFFTRNPHSGLLPKDPLYLGPELPWVAVLTNGRTASSGEAIAVCFRGREKSKSFGSATYGFSTGNAPFRLPDGATLYLATSRYADRTGKVYGGKIQPDENVEGEPESVIQAASKWILDKTDSSAEEQ